MTDSALPLNLKIPKPVKTVGNLMRYVRHASAAPRTIQLGMHDFSEWMDSNIDGASLKPHHEQLVKEMIFARYGDSFESYKMTDSDFMEPITQRDIDYMEIFPILSKKEQACRIN